MIRQLSEEERVLYTARLEKAREAYDALATGNAVKRFVDQNGETVEYTAAKLSDLQGYITSLENLLNPAVAAYRRPRAIGFVF